MTDPITAAGLTELEVGTPITVRGNGFTIEATTSEQHDGWIRAVRRDQSASKTPTILVSAEAIRTGLLKVESGWPEQAAPAHGPVCRWCGKKIRKSGRYWASTDPLDGGPWYCKPSPNDAYHQPQEAL